MTTLPDRLRELREAKGMTRTQLAEASGVSDSAIENIETGRTPDPRTGTFLALAKALGVSPDELAAANETRPAKRRPGRPKKIANEKGG